MVTAGLDGSEEPEAELCAAVGRGHQSPVSYTCKGLLLQNTEEVMNMLSGTKGWLVLGSPWP